MKKIYLIIALLISCYAGFAQDSLRSKSYLLNNKTHSFTLYGCELFDGYLSPLYYSGLGVQFKQDVRRVWSEKLSNLSMQNSYTVNLMLTLNPAYTANMFYLNFEYDWGMYYHLVAKKNLTFLLGGTVTPEIGGRLLPRNTNNIGNLDFGASINVATQMRWKIPTKKRVLELNVSFSMPVIGFAFAPQLGASYYEIFYLKNQNDIFHFTFFHNKYGFKRSYTLDIPFKNSVFRVGIQRNLLKYSLHGVFYKRKYGGIILGWQKNLFSFAGRKNKAPDRFIQY
ncbi:MAG: DUF3316 domain-containing protein [Bacteroidales bacterium]|nr:DUF3316 domain-containing protein [Bacteroidales bacterium]